MKRRFTILTAALALLTFLAVPMGMWGQARADQTVKWTASSGALGNGVGSGTITDNGSYSWSYTRTLVSGSSYTGWNSNCIQLGKNGGVENLTLTTSAIPGIIKSVAVECSSYQGKHNISISVGGTTYLASTATSSWTTVETKTGTGTSSGTITIAFTGGTRAMYIKSITVIYDNSGSGTLEDSDLAITGAPVALSFDLYNNASAQTISYTTSSTGAVTVSQSEYVNTSVSGNTITVTPVKVTPSAQTITVSQVADGTYDAGSATFTVEVTDSTPATIVTIDYSGITETDVYVSPNAGSLSATVTSGGNAISGATVTWSGNNDAVATIDATTGAVTLVGAGTVTFTASYAGVSGQYLASSATYEMTVTSSEPYVQPTTIEANLNDNFFGTNYGGSASGITDANPVSGTQDNVTITYAGSGNHYINATHIRFYPNNTLTFEAPSGYEITEIVFTQVSSGTWAATISANTGTYASNTMTWTGSASSVLFTGSGSSRCDMAKATVTLVASAAQYTLTNAMTNVAESFVFVGNDEIVFDNNNQAQVSAGATVYVSLTMEDCYALTSLTVNGSTTGVTEEEPGVYYSFVMPEGDATIGVSATQATEYTLTVVGAENVTFDMLAGAESNSVSLTNGTATLCEQTFVTIANLSANSGLILQSVTLTAGGSTTPLTLENGVYHFTMPSSNATLTFTTAIAPTYTLANSIESGKSYIIVGFDGDDAYAIGEQKTSNRAGVGITVDGTTAIGNANVHEVVITALEGDDAGKYTIEDNGYLYASSSSSNQLKTETNLNDNGKWTIVIENGVATITAQGSNSHKLMRFNPNNGNPLFACYLTTNTTTGSLPRLYVKDEAPVTETYTLDITGYTDVTEGTNNKGYYLIASPVTVDPESVEGMTDGDFDLYFFNQSQVGAEWQNYEANEFDLVPGKGYLYAKKATNNNSTYSFELTGTPYSGNGEIGLDYDDNAEFPGFNLIGNPFGTNANLDLPFYRLNQDGSALNTSTESGQINVMEGVFVQATAATRTANFTQATGAKRISQLNVKVTRNRGAVLDNAIIRFDDGAMLGKFQLNPNDTKIYITEGNQDYAIVRSANAGEMPVSFKAAENGNYTLSIETENVEVSYLHLIDNMTGADVDLLATPSYSFNARTTDNANRFRLMFNTNGVDENTTTANFAYFNGSSWTISNMGEATLQVVDMMGRVISTQAISGNTDVNLNQAAGVYMLRLVNGENVMVQKVVVR